MNFENNQETKKERKKNQREISQRSQRGERRKRNIRGPRILVPIRGIFLIIIAHIPRSHIGISLRWANRLYIIGKIILNTNTGSY